MFIIFFISTSFVAGLINATINAQLSESLQKYIDSDKIGKIATLIDFFGGILYPITAILAGYLIDIVSIYYAILMMIFGIPSSILNGIQLVYLIILII